MAQDFSSWLDSQVQGDYSDDKLKGLHEHVKTKHAKEQNPKKQKDLALVEQALSTAATQRVYAQSDELAAVDLSNLV